MKYATLSAIVLASAVLFGGAAANARMLQGTEASPTIYGVERTVGDVSKAGPNAAGCGYAGQPACDIGNVPSSVVSRGGQPDQSQAGF